MAKKVYSNYFQFTYYALIYLLSYSILFFYINLDSPYPFTAIAEGGRGKQNEVLRKGIGMSISDQFQFNRALL